MNGTPLRIALFTHSVNPRGGVVHTLELAQALHLCGHQVTIFAPAADGDAMFRESPCSVVLAPVTEPQTNTASMVSARIQALKRAFVQMHRRHDAVAFDVLHAQDSISGNALAELKEEGAIHGFVRTVHHLDHFAEPKLAEWQMRAWRDADAVLCVSDLWTRHMRDVYGLDALPVQNGVDLRRFSPNAATPLESAALRGKLGIVGAPVVLAVGGIEARKNTNMLLSAFALLRATHPNAQLVIAGGASLLDHHAYTREFFVRAASLGLAIGTREPVVVTGPLDDAVMPALFRCANAVAMVSLREGFGLVVLEALASRKPVVVSRIAPFTEYLDDRLCRWADPHDAASIACALRNALDRPDATDFLHAVPALLGRFSWLTSAHRHLDIYRHWLGEAAVQHYVGPVMPVMHFRIQWPDGTEANCYSPSTVVSEFFTTGTRYPLDDFLRRSREALNIGSERVREKFGFACSAAMDQLAQIEADAVRFTALPDATVTVLALG